MPPKAKKKRASLKLDPQGEVQVDGDETRESVPEKPEPSIRQVVEIVEETDVPEAIDTIKRDTEEIENAVETIEAEVKSKTSVDGDAGTVPVVAPLMRDEVIGEKSAVDSLFTKSNASVTPEITVVGKRGSSLGVWVGAMLGVALAIGVSLVLLVRGPSTMPFSSVKTTPTPQQVAASPTPVPVSVIKSDVKVSVLNGGGTPGAGSKMKQFLEGKGYSVVSVSNAKEYTYAQTEVLVKSGKETVKSLLSEDLKADYSLGTSSAAVDDGASFDVQVIVGKE